jgi:hypothetical protein
VPRRSKSNKGNQNDNVLASLKKREKHDYYVISMPSKLASLRAKIADAIVNVLREKPLLPERDIIREIIVRYPEIEAHVIESESVSMIRYMIWLLAKRRVILKAKLVGDNRHTYYFLPEQLEDLQSFILVSPREK